MSFVEKFRIHRHRTAERAKERNFVLIRKLADKWMLTPEVAFHLILGAPENLFTVITGVLPGIGFLDAAAKSVCAAEGFIQIDRIVHDRKIGNPVAVTDEVF